MEISPSISTFSLTHPMHSVVDNRGFTLVELLVTCALLGVMATIALVSISDFKDLTKTSRAAAEIRGLEKDIMAYNSEKGIYPEDEDAIGMENLKNMRDPWGNSYVYTRLENFVPINAPRTYVGKKINSDFDLYSKGSDGISIDPSTAIGNSKDDIIRAGDGSFTGKATLHGTVE